MNILANYSGTYSTDIAYSRVVGYVGDGNYDGAAYTATWVGELAYTPTYSGFVGFAAYTKTYTGGGFWSKDYTTVTQKHIVRHMLVIRYTKLSGRETT